MPALGLKLRLNRISARILSVITTNLQMWHKFTANPWTGSNRLPDSSPVGTNTGALFTGRALDFDGVNDWVNCGNPNITCRSLVLYINPDVTTDEIMRLTSTINVSIVSGTLTATGWTSPTRYVNGVAGNSVSAGAWHQIAITSATGFTVNLLELGRTSATAWYAGLMANVKIFSVELSAAQLAELYANPEQALPTGVTAGQLVGWWPLAEGPGPLASLDGSGNNNNGILSGASAVLAQPGMVPQWALGGNNWPLFYDNNDDSVNVGSGSSLNITGDKITIYQRYIKTSTDANEILFVRGSVGLNAGYITLSSSGTFSFSTYGPTNATLTSGANSAPNYKVLSVVATYDGATKKIYIDNVLSTSVACTGNINTLSGNALIGASSFAGVIFEMGIWAKDLTAAQIESIYNGANFTTIETASLRGAWRNTGNTAADWLDLSGNSNNGTPSGSPGRIFLPQGEIVGKDLVGMNLTHPNTGKFYDDTNSYVEITDAASVDITSAITLEAWVRPEVVNVAQTVIGKNSAYALNITSGAKLQFQRWSGTTSGTVASSASLVAGGWRHIAATYNGTTTLLYINGALDTTSTAISGAIDATSTAVLLGALTTTTQQFSGYIDNARIYSAVLTAAQIAGNYKAEKGAYN